MKAVVVAFLDLLGFSELLRKNQDAAVTNLVYFNQALNAKFNDYEKMKNMNVEEQLKEFIDNSSIKSFKDVISVSDSLIITSNDSDEFVKNISHLLSQLYIESNESYRIPYNLDTLTEEDKKYTDIKKSDLNDEYMKNVPLLFRGGASIGTDVAIPNAVCIRDFNKNTGITISGRTYLDAVKLEKSGKGPHLFCNKDFAQSLKDKSCIRLYNVSLGIYEIVWSYWGCEVGEKHSEPTQNINSGLEKMLIPALNLYVYYRSHNPDFLIYYKELVEIVCRGILKYDLDHCGNENHSSQKIIKEFTKRKINISEICNFLDLN